MLYEARMMNSKSEQTVIPVSEDERAALIQAKKDILFATRSESRVAIMVQNYMAFERLFLDFAIKENCTRTQHNTIQMIEQRVEADRVTTNLLSSCRMVLDQHQFCLDGMFDPKSKAAMSWNVKRANLRKKDFHYALIDSCRNIAQHSSLLIDSMSYHGVRHYHENEVSYREVTTKPHLDVEKVLNDERVERFFPTKWKDRLRDMKGVSNQCELRMLIRKYLESLWSLHDAFRETTKLRFVDASDCIDELCSAWEVANKFEDKSDIGLMIGIQGEKSTHDKCTYISRRWIKQFNTLRDGYTLQHLADWYVSSNSNPKSFQTRQ